MTAYPPAACAGITCNPRNLAQSVTPTTVYIHKYLLPAFLCWHWQSQESLCHCITASHSQTLNLIRDSHVSQSQVAMLRLNTQVIKT